MATDATVSLSYNKTFNKVKIQLDQYNENLKLQLQIKECYTPMYLAHNTSITPKLCYNLDLFSMNAVYI